VLVGHDDVEVEVAPRIGRPVGQGTRQPGRDDPGIVHEDTRDVREQIIACALVARQIVA